MSDNATLAGWTHAQLAELGSLRRGRGGTKADDDPDGVPCIRYGDLYTHHDCVVREFHSFVSPYSVDAYTPLRRGDVVFAGSGETAEEIGKAAVYVGQQQACAGADTIIFSPGASLDPLFTGYAVNSTAAVDHKSRMAQGSSVMHISGEHIGRLRLMVPPVPQQERIAEILSTVDEAIEQTEALIAKTQQIKAGLMHDLFTRGVTPDGQLRPPREEAPQLYKESPLGWIPNDWDVRLLDEVRDPRRPISYGVLKPGPYVEDGVPLLQIENVIHGGLDFTSVHRISLSLDAEYSRTMVFGGEIVISLVGTIGRVALLPTAMPRSNLHRNLGVVAAGPDMHSGYLSQFLQTGTSSASLVRATLGSTQSLLNLGALRKLPTPVPGRGEQRRIANIMDGISERIACEQASLHKLKQNRTGLMSDLLTGRVRVRPGAEERAAPP